MTRHRLRVWVDDDYMALFGVLDSSMEILEVETTASVTAALRGTAVDNVDCLATRIQSLG